MTVLWRRRSKVHSNRISVLFCIARCNFFIHWELITGVKKNYNDTHTHTHPFNGPLSGTTRVSRYQKGKTNLDFTEARDSEWQWHQLDHMQVCTSLQTDNHANHDNPTTQFFTGRMPFLLPNQQRQSTEGKIITIISNNLKFSK